MPTVQLSVAVAANDINDNVLGGSQFEFLPYNAFLEFGLQGSAIGLVFDVFTGQDTICESFEPAIDNRFAKYPDEYTLNDVAAAGERVKIRARNTTGGALTAFVSMRLNPAG